MIDTEKYTLLSKRTLSKEDINYLIADVNGARISWLGEVNKPLEIDSRGNIIYSFFCKRLTRKNRKNLKQQGLELKFVPINQEELSLPK